MKRVSKIFITALSIVLISLLSLPLGVSATTGTLGTESPIINAEFYDANSEQVDGNELETGEYTVNLTLSNMASVSIFNLTAAVTDDITVDEESIVTIGDKAESGFETASINYKDNSIIFVIATINSDTTAVPEDGVMVTFNVTVNTAGDFENYFIVSTDRDDTFVMADLGDGGEKAYVCTDQQRTDTDYPQLTVDVSPALAPDTYSVTGTIKIATDESGTSSAGAAIGVSVVAGDYENVQYSSAPSGTISTTTDSNGEFTLSGVPVDVTEITILGPTTINRRINISSASAETGNVNVGIVPVIVCDYNHSGTINALDKTTFNNYYLKESMVDGDMYIYCDLNGSTGTVNALDKTIFNNLYLNDNINYTELNF